MAESGYDITDNMRVSCDATILRKFLRKFQEKNALAQYLHDMQRADLDGQPASNTFPSDSNAPGARAYFEALANLGVHTTAVGLVFVLLVWCM